MKTFIKIFLITLLVSACFVCGQQSKRSKYDCVLPIGPLGWVFEGWSCPPPADRSKAPHSNNCRKKEFLYMKFSAAASSKDIDSGRQSRMEASCRAHALQEVTGKGLPRILGEYLEKASGVNDGQPTAVAIVASSKSRIKGLGLYDCCAINPNTGKCIKPGRKANWEQCICVGYMKYKGGEKAFEKALGKIQGY